MKSLAPRKTIDADVRALVLLGENRTSTVQTYEELLPSPDHSPLSLLCCLTLLKLLPEIQMMYKMPEMKRLCTTAVLAQPVRICSIRGKQQHRLFLLLDKDELIITDAFLHNLLSLTNHSHLKCLLSLQIC